MAMTFDSLGYAKRLKDDGIQDKDADALASAARDFIIPSVATKADLQYEIGTLRSELRADIAELRHIVERQTLQMTVRLGGLIVLGIAALVALDKIKGPI